jgi:hypothetical protein
MGKLKVKLKELDDSLLLNNAPTDGRFLDCSTDKQTPTRSRTAH